MKSTAQDFQLIAAPFTPFKVNGSVHLERIPSLAEFYIRRGIHAVFINGTTGEGPSLSQVERKQLAAAWKQATGNQIQVIVHVGHASVIEARELGHHAQAIGADGIAAVPPFYFKSMAHLGLLEYFKHMLDGLNELPFYFYYIPSLLGEIQGLPDLCRSLADRHSNFTGVKYSHSNLFELARIRESVAGTCRLFFGVDEMLVNALAGPIDGAVGSTYNFLSTPFLRLREAHAAGRLGEAWLLQSKVNRVIAKIHEYGGLPAMKHVMSWLDLDCGPLRAPWMDLTSDRKESLRKDLEAVGFDELAS